MIEAALYALVTGDAGVAALMGDRFYPNALPQAPTYPAATYALVAGESHYSMAGPSQLVSARVQIDLYADDHDQLLALKAALMTLLSGFRGEAGSPPVMIHGVFKSFEQGEYESDLTRSGLTVWRKSIDFQLWFKETNQ